MYIGLSIYAVDSCHWLFHFVPFDLDDMLLAEGLCAKEFFDYPAGFLWLDLLFLLLNVGVFILFFVFVWSVFLFFILFSFHLLKWLLF